MKIRGEWAPGGFTPPANLTITLILLILSGIRGGDYLFGDSPDTARRLSELEATMPLWGWGLLFLGAAVLGFASIILRWTNGLVWAHVLAWSTYWGVAAGLIMDVYMREEDADFFDEYVAAVLILGALLVFWTFRNSAWPLTPLVVASIMVCAALVVATYDWDGLRNATAVAGLGALNAVMAFGTSTRAKQNSILERK